jgi:hypothetical protein
MKESRANVIPQQYGEAACASVAIEAAVDKTALRSDESGRIRSMICCAAAPLFLSGKELTKAYVGFERRIYPASGETDAQGDEEECRRRARLSWAVAG